MKTHEQIQLALSLCKRNSCNKTCPYHGEMACYVKLHSEAGVALRQLERERDAAVEDLETMGEARAYCDTCLHNNTNHKEEPCISCMSGYLINNWQWRGVQEGE